MTTAQENLGRKSKGLRMSKFMPSTPIIKSRRIIILMVLAYPR